MRNKAYQTFCVCLAAATLVTSPALVYAAQEGEANVGDDVSMSTPGKNGDESGGDSNIENGSNSGTSSGGSSGSINNSYRPSSIQVGAESEKKDVSNILKDYIDQIKKDDSNYTWGHSNPSGDLNFFGTLQVPDMEIGQLLNHVAAFKDYLSQQEGLDSLLNAYTETSVTQHPQKELAGVDSSWGSLSEEEKKAIKEKIAEQEGISVDRITPAIGCTQNRQGTNGNLASIHYSDFTTPPFNTSNKLPSLSGHKGTDYTDIRHDIIENGFNDFNNWTGRFESLKRFTSNTMEDFCVLSYIQNYHIESVEVNKIDVIDYTSDVRRWQVIDLATGATMKTLVTNNPQHELTLNFSIPGKYQVVAEQEARYKQGTYVYYDVCDYLFDLETQNLLYFNEKTFSNGTGKTVYVGGETKEGWVATGDVFNWTINDLGEVETDGSATERIE